MFSELGKHLEAVVEAAHDEVLLVAPFIKAGVAERILSRCADSVVLKVVTRWRPDEIAAGVSDLDVYDEVNQRGGRLWLRADLHAKLFRADHRVLVGSANLTAAALGWRQKPNLELLVPWTDIQRCREFESDLFRHALEVDQSIKAMYAAAAEAFADCQPSTRTPSATDGFTEWRPSLRTPTELFAAYSAADDALAPQVLAAAAVDLRHLQPPIGLTKDQFTRFIRGAILSTPLMLLIDGFLSEQRRFGEVRDLLRRELSLDRDDATALWQTLIRWLREFFPERYHYSRYGHSELMRRRP